METFCGGLPSEVQFCEVLSCGTTFKMACSWLNGAVTVATISRMAEARTEVVPNLRLVRMLRELYRNRDGWWEIARYVGKNLLVGPFPAVHGDAFVVAVLRREVEDEY